MENYGPVSFINIYHRLMFSDKWMCIQEILNKKLANMFRSKLRE